MDENLSFADGQKPLPFTFAAIASKSLVRGEIVEFYVDSDGTISSPQLEFIQPITPQLLKKAPKD